MLEPPGIIRVVERRATSRTGMTTLARYGLIPSDLRRWTLVPLAGLEPATCCLGDDCQSSGLYGPVGSSQVRLGGVSGECGLVVRHPDVDVDPVALGRGASTCWNQNDGRGRGSIRSSSGCRRDRGSQHGTPERHHLGADERVDRYLHGCTADVSAGTPSSRATSKICGPARRRAPVASRTLPSRGDVIRGRAGSSTDRGRGGQAGGSARRTRRRRPGRRG
jgi:hypothetical protein